MELLQNSNIDTYPLFSLKGLITYAKVLSVYDGDTCNILLLYNDNKPLHLKARLYGYDSPEIRISLLDDNREEKKKKAIDAKNYLWNLCTGCDEKIKNHKTIVKIKCGNFDKYGRLLVTIFPYSYDLLDKDDDIIFNDSINNRMIQNGYGYPYFGGTKQK